MMTKIYQRSDLKLIKKMLQGDLKGTKRFL